MLRILYFSTATRTMSRDEITGIVAHAREKNSKLGITGSLGYNGRNFCQLLEGDPDQVLGLLDTIEQDPRHTGFKVLDRKEVASRAFPDWSMELVDQLDFSTVINAMTL